MEPLKEILSKKTILVSLLLILSFGSFLRFYGLSNQSLWNDELSSWSRSNYENLTEVIKKGAIPDAHPPGFHIVLFFVEKYIGDTESILRSLSAIAGSLSLFVIFLVGSSLYTFKEGIISSALLAFSGCAIYYSQEVRPYSLLLLFILTSTYFWICLLKYLHSNNSNPNFLIISGYVISAIIASYLHYFGLLFIALQGIGFALSLLHTKKGIFYTIIIYGLIILAYIPWCPILRHHMNGEGITWINTPNYRSVLSYLLFCFNYSAKILLFIISIFLFCLVHKIAKTRSTRNWKSNLNLLAPTPLVLFWLIVPFSFAYIISITTYPILTNRNLIISLPAVYLLLAKSITSLPLRPIYKNIIPLVIIILLMSHTLFIIKYYSTPQKQQFRESVNYIVEYDNIDQRSSIIVGYARSKEYFNYYFEKMSSPRTIDILAGRQKDIPILYKMINEKEPQYIWLISAHIFPEKEFLYFIKSKFRLVITKKYKGATVWLFKNLNTNSE
ncbi:MAG: glycosyltransferase family 39 protein [Candidatus Celaenobacter antarcticus]|nr:glycosyltransferase family 39 protein [Candidatus Celaenobacter antarcticus]